MTPKSYLSWIILGGLASEFKILVYFQNKHVASQDNAPNSMCDAARHTLDSPYKTNR